MNFLEIINQGPNYSYLSSSFHSQAHSLLQIGQYIVDQDAGLSEGKGIDDVQKVVTSKDKN